MNKDRFISDHFSAAEVECRCGDCDRSTADVELVAILERARTAFGNSPVVIHSWFRCMEHNNRPRHETNRFGVSGVGSNRRSMHPTGGAVDSHIVGVPPLVWYNWLDAQYPNRCGIGIYDWGVHFDIRNRKARWDERT